jgi:hypothetical protein
MATDDFTNQPKAKPRLATLPSSAVAEPSPDVNDALARLIEAQNVLASSLAAEARLADPVGEIEVLLSEAQATADEIVERAELEALTIRRLMRIEAERLLANVERLKERAQRIEEKVT